MSKVEFSYEEELAKCRPLEDITGKNGLVQKMVKNAIEAVLKQEMDQYLKESAKSGEKLYRNGSSKKKMKTSYGDIELDIPRDRAGNFEPEIVKKREIVEDGIESQVISMYSKGMSTRDICEHIQAMYGIPLSAASVSNITDKVMGDAKEWYQKSLECIYPILFLDAVHFKVKEDHRVVTKAAYVALGITTEGQKDVLGIWIGENEGAKFWLKVCNELKSRGVQEILIACIDGLKGFPDAISTVFPDAKIQLCVIHQIRNSMKYVASKDQKEFIRDLKQVYRAASEEIALVELEHMMDKWGKKYGMVLDSWVNNWENISTYFGYGPHIRKLIYTTNTLEGFNRQLRKLTKTRTVYPSDDSLKKNLYLATNEISR